MAAPVADRTRLLYLGLDACDAPTMLDLVRSGHCPNIAGLLTEAATAESVAPYGTFIGSAWMTFTTAWKVGRHRFYSWIELDRETYEYRETTPLNARGRPFWSQLSDRGRRVAVIDVPHSSVPDDLNGILVKEWGCHDRHHGTGSFPTELLDEIGDHPYASGDHPRGNTQFAVCDYTRRDGRRRTLDEERQLLDLILAGVEAKTVALERLLDRGGWDAFIAVVGESHCVGHQLWHVHDEHHPRFDPATRAVLGDPVVRVYEAVDATVGRIVHAAGPNATVFLHLSHGMQAHYDGDHVLGEILRRIELSHDQPRGWRTRIATGVLGRAPEQFDAALHRGIAAALRRRIDRSPPSPLEEPRPSREARFFQLPGNTAFGAVRLSLRGRDPHGCVDPAEVDAAVEELTTALREVMNVDTGGRVVTRVVRAEDVLDRSDGDEFPDLFVEWERSAPIERVWSPRIGTVAIPYSHWRTGDHHDRGLLIVRGGGIEPGPRPTVSFEDLGPTLAHALGVELDDVDGAPRLDLVGAAGGAEIGDAATMGVPPSTPHRRRASPPSTADRALELAADAARRSDLAEVTAPRVDELEEAVAKLQRATLEADRAHQVWTTMLWLERTTVDEDELVSVITPTHKRPDKLAEAIRSVQAQTYGRWEMVIVNDGSDEAKEVVADVGDERVRVECIEHRGASGARNVGLDLVRGSIVTYLDDDNLLDAGWLKAVVWGFRQDPEAQVLYGARLVDGVSPALQQGTPGIPWMQFEPFDREILLERNFADQGVIAHRAGLPEARFDESIREFCDWDFFLTITEHRKVLELPVIALQYFSEGDDRLSGTGTGPRAHDLEIIRDKWRPDETPSS